MQFHNPSVPNAHTFSCIIEIIVSQYDSKSLYLQSCVSKCQRTIPGGGGKRRGAEDMPPNPTAPAGPTPKWWRITDSNR